MPDTDNDGLLDEWELKYSNNLTDFNGLNNNDDNDNDGLTNLVEYGLLTTNPTLSDTDSDGLSDSKEISLNTKPTVADTDGDGLNDGAEIIENTNPLLIDTDSDGYTDNQEFITGSNPLDSTLTPPNLVAYFDFEGATDAEKLADKSAWGNDAVIKERIDWRNYNSNL